MKNIFSLITALVVISGIATACNKGSKSADANPHQSIGTTEKPKTGAPPATWKEHWFAHDKLLDLVYYNDDLALYYDDGMDRSVQWDRSQLTNAWRYIKKTYGNYGDSSRLYVIMHGIPQNATPIQAGYSGGHPSPYYDASHDYRNTIDCGLGNDTWPTGNGDAIRQPIHEMGHIVASSSYGVTHDISSGLWSDSKFAEIFIYDVLMNINRQQEAQEVYQQMQTQYDNFPAANTQWFKNWFYPIYDKYGQGAVLARYFKEISDNAHERSEELNLGEFVHFFSGAAGVNLSDQAKTAFGSAWNDTAKAQLKKAQAIYPNVKYPY